MVSAGRDGPGKRARPNIPERNVADIGRSIFTRNACETGSTRAISVTRPAIPSLRPAALSR